MATLVARRYRTVGPLGSGGMGSVVLAQDTWRGDREVALKLAPDDDAGSRSALEREFEILRALRHPHVVGVLDHGECHDTRQIFLAMEHVPGPSLAACGPELGTAAACRALSELAQALAFVHARGIVHRDVKADNVVLDARGGGHAARLLDFGLATAEGTSSTPGFSGTLSHAAPDVLAGVAASPGSDLYSLGATAFEALTGRAPFEHRGLESLVEAHAREEAPRLTDLVADLPAAASDMVAQLLEKDPTRRPSSALAVASVFMKAAGQERPQAGVLEAWARVPRLVGQREAAERARASLDSWSLDRGPAAASAATLLLVGPPGSGKSRLLGEMEDRARLMHARVLRGTPGHEPWSLFVEPLREAARWLGSGSEVLARHAVEVAIIDPRAKGSAPDAFEGLTVQDRRLRVGHAVAEILRAVAVRPVALLLDDVDRADEESAWLVGHLLRHIAIEGRRGALPRLVLAASSRPGPAAGSLLGAFPEGSHAHLSALDAAEVREAVQLMFPGMEGSRDLAAALFRGVGGNVDLMERWCAALVRQGAIQQGASGWEVLPSALSEAPPPDAEALVEDAIAALGTRPRQLLLDACVLPSPVLLEALAATGTAAQGMAFRGAMTRDLDELADRLEAAGLVVAPTRTDGRSLAPSSEAVRQAGRRILGLEGLRSSAGRLHDALRAGPALAPADLAHLAEDAGRRGEAAAHLRAALAVGRARTDDALRAQLAGRLARVTQGAERRAALRDEADALLLLDRLDAAEARLRAADVEPHAPAGSGERLAGAALAGRVASRRGRFDLAAEAFARALETDDGATLDQRLKVMLELARALSQSGSPRAGPMLDELLASPLPDGLRLSAQIALGAHALRTGRTDEAERVLGEALVRAGKLGRAIEEAACENNLGVAALRRSELALASRHLKRAADLRRRAGARGALAGTLTNLGLVELARGRPAAAARHARACVEIQEEIGNLRGELLARSNHLVALVDREDVAAAMPEAERVRRLLELSPHAPSERALEGCLAATDYLLGRSAAALAHARRARELGLDDDPDQQIEAQAMLLLCAPPADESGMSHLLLEEVAAAAETASGRIPIRIDALCACAERLECADGPWLDIDARESPDATRARGLAQRAFDLASEPGEGHLLPRSAAALAAALMLEPGHGRDARAAAEEVLARVDDAVMSHARPSDRVRVAAARASLAAQRGDLEEAAARLAGALEVIRQHLRRIPRPLRAEFLAAPARSRVRDALFEVRRRSVAASRDAAWFAVLDDASHRGRETAADVPALVRSERRARKEAGRLREVLEIGRGINTLLPVDDLLQRVLESAMRFVDADRGFIVLGPPEALSFAASRDRAGGPVPQAAFAVSRSVLQEVVRTRQAVMSSDARVDERFTSKASVLALDLRSVLVAPLVARSEVIGALYVDDARASGAFDDADRDVLALLAMQAAVAVENASLHATRIEKERLDGELLLAHDIQQGLLPRHLPATGAFALAAAMEPARDVGGDWYDVVPGPGGRLRVGIGDVSGKGVPAALFMVMARTILRALTAQDAPLDVILAEANDVLESQIEDDKFMTYLLLEPALDGRSVKSCLAGHEPPLLCRTTGQVEVLKEGGLALGMLRGIGARLEERLHALGPGDILVAYSDGVTEARAPDGSMFGRARLVEAVRTARASGAQGVLDRVLGDLARFRAGVDRSDDVTLLVLEAL